MTFKDMMIVMIEGQITALKYREFETPRDQAMDLRKSRYQNSLLHINSLLLQLILSK